ncbi:hypothetical protein ADK70_28040 [Streptomyces rimosus subsp. pseudoverticillatus]|nr:hypothetical protein ADK70_28040 [Streptomyces rimosus subsp. pseudoverticillatus]
MELLTRCRTESIEPIVVLVTGGTDQDDAGPEGGGTERDDAPPVPAKANEVGHAQKPLFVARYLRLRDLQREIEEGLDVMESSNGANFVIAYGKGGEIASNRRDEQEMFVLCLRILQSALVHVNTLMLQDIP